MPIILQMLETCPGSHGSKKKSFLLFQFSLLLCGILRYEIHVFCKM